jgi:hypothetical protein
LVEELPSGGILPEWRCDDGLGSLALCIFAAKAFFSVLMRQKLLS